MTDNPETSTLEDETPWPPPARGWLLAGLLALASIVSQFDRTVINLTVAPVKQRFSLDDTHFALLQGVAFGVFYTVACVPIGRLADRASRKHIIAIGLALFSLFSMSSGLVRTYTQLFLTRMGVGVGEASLSPAAFSMLADQFPPDKLGRPVAAFLMSAPVGQGLALILGGSLLDRLEGSPLLGASGPLGTLDPWQAAFLIIGFPGLLLVPFLLTAREPERRGTAGLEALPLRDVIALLRVRSGALIPMFAGFAMVTLVAYSLSTWTPAFFARTYGWSATRIGLAYGVVLMTFGMSGGFFGGWLSDRLAAHGSLDAPLRAAAFGFVGCGVTGVLTTQMPTGALALAFLAPTAFFCNVPFACAATAIQLLLPNRARAQASALYITLTTLVGLGVGPLVVGLMTDHLFHDPGDIRYALAIVLGLAAPTMFVLLMLACRPYRALRAG